MPRIKDSQSGKFINLKADKKYLDKIWLHQQYVILNRTTRNIAKECNVDKKTILNHLKFFNIPIKLGIRDYTLLSPKPYMNKEWLETQYLTKTVNMIAIESNVCRDTLAKWMKYFHIPTRDDRQRRTGKFHWNFKGKDHVSTLGYKYLFLPDHPRAKTSQRKYYIREHIVIMEKFIGRFLQPGEEVHHNDGNKLNNNIENLTLFSTSSKHIKYEMLVRDFSKKLLFGNLPISNRPELLELFNNFVKEQG